VDAALNWLWQGCVVAVTLSVALRLLERARANVRYIVCWAAVLLILVLPAFAWLGTNATWPDAVASGSASAVLSVPDTWWTSSAVMVAAWMVWASVYLVRFVWAMVALRRAELPVDYEGTLTLDRVEKAVTDDTACVSVMWANNETGVLFPVEQIATICRQRRVPFHCDGTQAVGKISVDVAAAGFDAMSLASHKFHGPKGVGSLFVRRGVRIRPLVIGGPQERQRRGGTENVAGIVGMGKAAELAAEGLAQMPRVASMRDRLERQILENIADTSVNGSRAARLPNTTNISFARLEAEAILILLSEQNIAASAGAACSSGSLEPSHVLRAMGIDPKIAHGAIRFSLSRYTTDAEIDRAVEVLPKVIARLRAVLPVG
jgi:cysteine sulfinate desulfinase/cysteine desulfurase-like protein